MIEPFFAPAIDLPGRRTAYPVVVKGVARTGHPHGDLDPFSFPSAEPDPSLKAARGRRRRARRMAWLASASSRPGLRSRVGSRSSRRRAAPVGLPHGDLDDYARVQRRRDVHPPTASAASSASRTRTTDLTGKTTAPCARRRRRAIKDSCSAAGLEASPLASTRCGARRVDVARPRGMLWSFPVRAMFLASRSWCSSRLARPIETPSKGGVRDPGQVGDATPPRLRSGRQGRRNGSRRGARRDGPRVTAPPTSIQEDASFRAAERSRALLEIVGAMASRAARRDRRSTSRRGPASRSQRGFAGREARLPVRARRGGDAARSRGARRAAARFPRAGQGSTGAPHGGRGQGQATLPLFTERRRASRRRDQPSSEHRGDADISIIRSVRCPGRQKHCRARETRGSARGRSWRSGRRRSSTS